MWLERYAIVDDSLDHGPLLNVNVRRRYGFGAAITSNGSRMTARFAWPSAEFGGIPVEGGIDAAFKRVIESASDRRRRPARRS